MNSSAVLRCSGHLYLDRSHHYQWWCNHNFQQNVRFACRLEIRFLTSRRLAQQPDEMTETNRKFVSDLLVERGKLPLQLVGCSRLGSKE